MTPLTVAVFLAGVAVGAWIAGPPRWHTDPDAALAAWTQPPRVLP